jgi:hypothetical protein
LRLAASWYTMSDLEVWPKSGVSARERVYYSIA